MKLLLALAVLVPSAVGFAADQTGLDPSTMLVSYGVAAPFAGLCFWQLQKATKRAEIAEAKVEGAGVKVEAAAAKVEALQTAAVEREREFAMRLAPLLYDGALLYQRGNERLAQGMAQTPPPSAVSPTADDDELHALRDRVEELLRKLGEGER